MLSSLLLLLAFALPLALWIYGICTPYYSTPIRGIHRVTEKAGPLGDLLPTLSFYYKTLEFHRYFEDLAREHGSIYQYFFLRKPIVVLSDLKEVEDILGRRSGEFDRARTTSKIFSCMARYGMLALPTNEMWRHHVRLFGPAMSNQNLRLVTPSMTDIISQLITLWDIKSKHLGSLSSQEAPEGCFDAGKDIDFTTVDIISRLAFGESYRQLESTLDLFTSSSSPPLPRPTPSKPTTFPYRTSPLAKASKLFFDSIPAVSPSPDQVHKLYTFLSPSYRNARNTIHSFVDHQIADARARARVGEGGRSLLDGVVEKEMKDGEKLDMVEMRDEVMNFLIAGEETTASTLRWLVRYLAEDTGPEIQRRLRKELMEALPTFGEQDPTFDEIQQLDAPYFEAIIQELLRLSSTVSVSYRKTLCPTTILGHPVPTNTEVLMLIGFLGRTTGEGGWKEDASKFRPERWLDEEGRFDSKAGPSLPFSLGPRSCFGWKLATLELKLFLVQLNAAFFLDSVPKELRDSRAREIVTRRPEQCFVRLRKWEDV
ncbi:cytochrome P450 [Mrakia frigida]|uniref:cytochrome P450 n=1 Tax=Mrakia frigida TaxID=29902 RepID=UPI003FCC117B